MPFDAASLDLVVLPHALELARDPHLALREVERVLVPEGRVIIVGFNPASLWGARQRLGRLRRRLARAPGELFLPHAGEFIGYRRLRDWLRLLSFEVEAGRFGCYIPPVTSARWLSRFDWMERAGDHWWPVFGALYYIVAVKRVRGMRLVGLISKEARVKAVTAPAPVAATPHARAELGRRRRAPKRSPTMKWIAYTDGACAPTNPGPAGWGAVLIAPDAAARPITSASSAPAPTRSPSSPPRSKG